MNGGCELIFFDIEFDQALFAPFFYPLINLEYHSTALMAFG